MRDLEKSAGANYLTTTAAHRTINTARSRLGSGASAFIADIQFSNFNFLFCAESRFLERDLHVVTQIRATLSIFAVSSDAAKKGFENSAANAAAAENFTEDIEGIVKSAAKTSTLLKRGVSEAIVSGAFVRIHQDVVGLTQFFEFFFGVRVIRVFIRMKFYRELAISAFDLRFGRTVPNSENFVIIAFCIGCQNLILGAKFVVVRGLNLTSGAKAPFLFALVVTAEAVTYRP